MAPRDILTLLTSHMRREQTKKEFDELDRRSLSRLTDKELADWQVKQEKDSPQSILAEHEWSCRLTAAQIKGMRYNVIIGAVTGAIIGCASTLFGVYLNSHLNVSLNRLPQQIRSESQPTPTARQLPTPQPSATNQPTAMPPSPGAIFPDLVTSTSHPQSGATIDKP
jgi:hypothetical protein